MKRSPAVALIACAFLALGSLTAKAVPITLSLDNPNQVTAAPSIGAVTLTFTGTVTVAPGYRFSGAFFDAAWNSSQTNFVTGSLDAGFAIAWNGIGTYTGALFTINVNAGTPADLYSFMNLSSNPSQFYVHAIFSDNINSDVKGESEFTANQAYSVAVTQGNIVPDHDATLLLLGVTVAILYFARRMFLLKAWPTTG
jgi:hypothetical protein